MKTLLHLVIMLLVISIQTPVRAEILFYEDFETESIFNDKLINKPYVNLLNNSSYDGSNAIEVNYQGYEMGSKRVVLHQEFESGNVAATLSFWVFFDDNFQWVKGGKLHGLGSLFPVTGGDSRNSSNWSARIMFNHEGRISAYIYDQDPAKKWGTAYHAQQPVLSTGVWHQIELCVNLNTPTSSGEVNVIVDGSKVIDVSGITFRTNYDQDSLVNSFLFSTFHGGNTPAWAPKDELGDYTTVQAYFDDFEVRTEVSCDY